MHDEPGSAASAGPSVSGRGLVLVGLAGIAITQPILDLLGRSPQFFVAGRYTGPQIVAFGLIVALVPSAVLVLAFVLGRRVHPRVGDVVHGVLLALLGALFANVLLRGLGIDRLRYAVIAAGVGALLVTWLVRRRAGHLLLQYLAIGNLLFLVSFLVMSPTSELVAGGQGSDDLGAVSVPPLPGPVLVIVMDELPLATIVRPDGTINEERYPAFARLAAGSTWYRNASSPHNATDQAVPAILTGVVHEEAELPTYEAQPRNLLALFGLNGPVERYEAFTDMCPPTACEAQPAQPLRQALEDALTVYGHRVLPPTLRADLSPIDDAWGGFGDAVGAAAPAEPVAAAADPRHHYRDLPASERAATTQAAHLVAQAEAIDGAPILHFVHVVFPHSPWFATPWGTTLMPPMPDWIEDPTAPGFEENALLRYQRHSLQVGAADRALGAVLDHLEAAGLWDETTVVLTADHGTSTIPPDLGRAEPTAANADEVFRVPLFLKTAGQTNAEVNDDVAMTIDVLPTLVDLFDIETDWEMDGHSLLDGSARSVEPLVSTSVDPLFAVARRHEADFPHGWDWTALAAIGAHGALVGTPVADLEIGAPSGVRWAPTAESSFGSLPNERGETPQLMIGHLDGPGAEEPPELVIVANGIVAGVTGGYKPSGERWWFSSVLGPYLIHGANEIDAYEVTTVDGRPVLHLVG